MSAAGWIRRQRDRPIAEHERRAAMSAVVVLLSACALLLALTQPASPQSTGHRGRTASNAALPVPVKERRTGTLTPEVQSTAKRFLAGYLGYVYGHTPARQIEDATPALLRSLQAHPPRVPPAARARHPRVLSLRPTSAPAGEVAVSAVVNDGGLIDYSVGLVLASEHGRLLVIGLEGA